MTPAAVSSHQRFTCLDPCIQKRTENFSQPLQRQSPVVTPLVLIIVRDKFTDPFPILFFDLDKKVCAVQLDLAFRLPKFDEVNTHDEGDNKPGINSIPETYRHPER